MATRQFSFLLLLTLLLGCTHRQAEPISVPEEPSRDAEVYAQVIRLRGYRPGIDTILVADRAVRYTPPPANAAQSFWGSQLDSIPRELRQRLAVTSSRPLSTSEFPLPRPFQVLTERQSQRVQRQGLGARVVFGLSPIAFSDDGQDALVVIEARCGPVCGGGALVWLRRDPNGTWRIRLRVPTWFG